MIGWQDLKTVMEEQLHLSRDAMHIYAALIIFLLACWIFRWKPSDWRPWLVVLLAQCFNEALDMASMLEDDGVIWIWSSVKDTVNTMITPTLLLIAARYAGVFGGDPAPRGERESGDEPEV